MFKKFISMFIAALFLLALAACAPANQDQPQMDEQSSSASIPPAEITDQTEDMTKELVPLEHEEGEQLESLYYRIVQNDGELNYEVQPKGEEKTMLLPMDSVIYIVSSPDECKVEKVSFQYKPDGGEAETIEQYRIYVTSSGMEPASAAEEDSTENQAVTEEDAVEQPTTSASSSSPAPGTDPVDP